jgi:hypothetical protein
VVLILASQLPSIWTPEKGPVEGDRRWLQQTRCLVPATSSLPLLQTVLVAGRNETISKLMVEYLPAESDSLLEEGKEHVMQKIETMKMNGKMLCIACSNRSEKEKDCS